MGEECNVWTAFCEDFIMHITSYLSVCPSISNIAKMEDAKVEIDDGKDESVLPDTMYQ